MQKFYNKCRMKKFINYCYLAIIAIVMMACGGISPELDQLSGEENGHGYMDLGLSVMWAHVNMGAEVVGEYGDFYAWGETEPKDYFSYDNYKYCKREGTAYKYLKYCTDPSSGPVDGLTTLEPEDDAAHVQWGGSWRMPTKEEWIELREKCTWKYSHENNKKGWTVTGPNGNKIFFPLAGGQTWNEISSRGSAGYYRSATLGEKYSSTTYIVIMFSDDDDESAVTWSDGSRAFGQSIRPVCTIVK